ncbi:MAG TPA: murein biosynthesis integral membrane protein MurJ [Candidatus Limnocylindrales bacterium]|nr:murein biosynthesis integral membrane protein MurJ [Candidatus Limnocylindrales bacterium]
MIEDPAASSGAPATTSPERATGRTLARAGLIVTLAFLASRVLGYVRLAVITASFPAGAERELDTFFAAFRVPDLMFQLVAAGALSTALIPLVSGLIATGEEARAWRLVSSVTTLMVAALGALTIILWLAAPIVVPPLVPGFAPDQAERTVELTRTMLLGPLFLALGSVATSILNARGRFGPSAIAPIAYNAAIIAGALLLVPGMGVAGLAVSVVAGSLAHVLVQLGPVARLGFRFRPGVDRGDPLTARAFALMAPRAIGLGGAQVTFLVMTTLATTLAAGAVSGFTLAFTVLQIPIGVIGVPLGVVLLPSLAQEAALGDERRFGHLLARALGLLVFVMLGITALGIVLADEAVRILFGHGGLDEPTLVATAAATATFLLGLTAHSLIAVLARAFYARQDTLTPVLAALAVVGLDAALALAFVGPLGLSGLALAIAIGAWMEAFALAIVLRRRIRELSFAPAVATAARSLPAALGAGAAAWAAEQGMRAGLGADDALAMLLVRAATAAAAGGLVYLALSALLRIPELPAMVDLATDLVRRRATAR